MEHPTTAMIWPKHFTAGYVVFTVNHFNGPVTYSSDGFLERNLDVLNLDFVGLLWGASTSVSTSAAISAAGVGLGTTDTLEGAGSINPLVKGLFSGKAIVTQAHPKSEDTVVTAQQPIKPTGAPSTWHRGTLRRIPVGCDATTATIAEEDRDDDDAQHGNAGASEVGATRVGAPCVMGGFHAALDTLFDTLSETQAWYIFHINPNDLWLANHLEGYAVKVQVRSVGLGAVVARCGGGDAGAKGGIWEVSIKIGEFWKRYRAPLSKLGISMLEEREQRGGVAWV